MILLSISLFTAKLSSSTIIALVLLPIAYLLPARVNRLLWLKAIPLPCCFVSTLNFDNDYWFLITKKKVTALFIHLMQTSLLSFFAFRWFKRTNPTFLQPLIWVASSVDFFLPIFIGRSNKLSPIPYMNLDFGVKLDFNVAWSWIEITHVRWSFEVQSPIPLIISIYSLITWSVEITLNKLE